MKDRLAYATPKLVELGRVVDLTKTGFTHTGGDAKGGSVAHSRGV